MEHMATNDDICRALAEDRTIDITTIGRRSGEPRRIETWFHNLAGEIYLTGTPGKRDWYANLVHHPAFTFHLKETATADLDARALPITETEDRRSILQTILARLDREGEVDRWVEESPLVRVVLDVDCLETSPVNR